MPKKDVVDDNPHIDWIPILQERGLYTGTLLFVEPHEEH